MSVQSIYQRILVDHPLMPIYNYEHSWMGKMRKLCNYIIRLGVTLLDIMFCVICAVRTTNNMGNSIRLLMLRSLIIISIYFKTYIFHNVRIPINGLFKCIYTCVCVCIDLQYLE